jgi:hypothetical protein
MRSPVVLAGGCLTPVRQRWRRGALFAQPADLLVMRDAATAFQPGAPRRDGAYTLAVIEGLMAPRKGC